MLVIDLADQLLDDILHRHQSRSPAVLVHNDRDMRFAKLQLLEQLRNLHGTRHKDDRLDIGGNRNLRTFNIIMKIFLIQHADDIVKVVLIDRQSRKSGAQKKRRDLVLALINLNGFDIHARRQHVPGFQVVELDRVLNQLALLPVDAALGLCLLHQRQQLILGDRFAVPGTKEQSQQLLPAAKQPVDRRQNDHKKLKQRRRKHRELLRAFLCQTLR